MQACQGPPQHRQAMFRKILHLGFAQRMELRFTKTHRRSWEQLGIESLISGVCHSRHWVGRRGVRRSEATHGNLVGGPPQLPQMQAFHENDWGPLVDSQLTRDSYMPNIFHPASPPELEPEWKSREEGGCREEKSTCLPPSWLWNPHSGLERTLLTLWPAGQTWLALIL